MKNKLLKILSLALVGVLFSACAIAAGHSVPTGSLYTGVTQGVSGNGPAGGKQGEACSSGILGLVATGDAGIKAAAAQGNIKAIATVDHKLTTVLGSVYVSSCTIVTGN